MEIPVDETTYYYVYKRRYAAVLMNLNNERIS